MHKVRGTITLDIESEFEDNESTLQTLLYCITQDLYDLGYVIHSESIEDV